MNRFFTDPFGMREKDSAAQDLHALAEELRSTDRGAMRMRPGTARRLRADLARAARLGRLDALTDDGLRRLNGDGRRIEACLRQAESETGGDFPAAEGEVRILALARHMVAGGETALTRERLLRCIADFDALRPLEMEEIQHIPGALHIALCEGLQATARDVLRCADERLRAGRWADRGGRAGEKGDAVFLEHALRLADEGERPELHARLSKLLERRGERADWVVERAHRIAADCCMRLENLMQLKHLLDSLNWRRCFEELSVADEELREDPANVYANMDGSSRAAVRDRVAEMARRMDMEERTLVRCGLAAARDALRDFGRDDPRACICYYFAANAGARALAEWAGVRVRQRRCVPDPTGRGSVALVVLCALLVMALCMLSIGRRILMPYALLLAWVPAVKLLSRVYPHFVRPGRILKMKLRHIPDAARTLVALPVLLSSEGRAREMIDHMEALGCLEADSNIDFLLLGDFRDADSAQLPDDDAILNAAREGVARLNVAAGREKYFYLHRARSFRGIDGRWMGENRKRGALTALNRLILNRDDAEAAFTAENAAAGHIAARAYRYVVTLDADTEYLPGTLQKLIGAMLHPLNRAGVPGGYGVLQPDMQMAADTAVNGYVELTAGLGGVDGYPVSVSNFYQDMTGHGNFSGKGIYDVRAFAEATEGRLPDDSILSHDLIEGILCGAGYVNDVSFYDGAPADPVAVLRREHRWTRGDWQLLPVLFSKLKLAAVDRMKLIGNLLRSLYAPALLGLLIHSMWLDEPRGFLLGLALAYLEAILHPLQGENWRRATLQLALLPAQVKSMLDAVLRTLYRLTVSHRHLMDWVPAADATGSDKGELRVPGRIAAILLLPGLLRPFWVPAVLALAALFLVGPGWAEDLVAQRRNVPADLSANQRALLEKLARETWSFFENYVPADGTGLPPDNVQMDPPAGAARRTSPTNIGLYLMSCMAAQVLDLIPRTEMLGRMAATVCTLEKLDKWNGQLYNWYDLNDLAPLRPRYVSAVDSGNLAGALLLCAREVQGDAAGLSGRMRTLARNMDLAALYDGERKLFHIGMDVESGRLSQSHYDLYASEARILSFAAIMLGQVPASHWRRLSRPAVAVGRDAALLSWSGTMFEYLMPELLLRSADKTLAGQSRCAAVACQMRHARRLGRPWGVSESGYYAFDLQLNYQYRAFGLRELALDGSAVEDVVAPYASALALCCAPGAAADNLRRMRDLGWCGRYGMYEAADYLHAGSDGAPRLIRSYMAHHQGMILCALCNALRDDALARRFMEIPQARALRLLLQEKRGVRLRLHRRPDVEPVQRTVRRSDRSFARSARPERDLADVHLLHGGNTTALATGSGAVFAWHEGLQLNRFSGDLLNRHEGMYVHLRDEATGDCAVFGRQGDAEFDAGCARYRMRLGNVQALLQVAVSPESGALVQRIELENQGDAFADLEVTGCLAVALAPDRDMRAHPVFQNLFVESRRMGDSALAFRRRAREAGGPDMQLIYLASGAPVIACETDLDRLVGRNGSLGEAGGIARQLSGTYGNVLNPCAALRLKLRLEPGEKRALHFALATAHADALDGLVKNLSLPAAADRALQLAEARSRAALEFAGVDAQLHRILQRAAGLIFDAQLRMDCNERFEACPPIQQRSLWSVGISGELPILLAEVTDPDRMDGVRELIRAHGFYRMMGVQTDLVLISAYGNDYLQPVHSALEDRVAASHLCDLRGVPGGVFLLDRQNLDEEVLHALRRAAALRIDGDISGLRTALSALERRGGVDYATMTPAAMDMPENLRFFNGYGGFDGEGYAICLRRDALPPAPWSNVIASERAGAILTERGGGFAWHGNSRSGRITPFANDVLREGWGWMFYLADQRERRYLRLLPGDRPMTDFLVRHVPDLSSYAAVAQGLRFHLEVRCEGDEILFDLELENRSGRTREWRLAGLVDWRMGTDAADACMLRTWSRFGACFASGTGGVGYFVSDDLYAGAGCSKLDFYAGGDMMAPRGLDSLELAQGGWILQMPLRLHVGARIRRRFALGAAQDVASAYARVRALKAHWPERAARAEPRLQFETPDARINLLANGFLQAQVRNARIFGRTGLYQPGGAYGFRDQLQDMLPLIHEEPRRVRRHLLYCAARQFPSGDVLHWWHEPYTGVRTHIRDDLLFLPYVTAQYVRITGDASVLEDSAPFLEEVEIPEGREDVYAEMRPSTECASLHEHCMRAFRCAAAFGAHGLCLMGGGDWNDGMNRVGAQGRGESVWLSEFLAVCAADYASIAPGAGDRAWLTALNERMCAAVESCGWDGDWYLRAYLDDGRAIGGRNSRCCRIDAISQAWAVLAGLDPARCRSAMDAAWWELADAELGAIKLLTPPFDGVDFDPGYIAAYPPGIRENGAQYTHGACWLALALVRMGDAERAHRALELLLPVNHSNTKAAADRYRVEPYVMTADIYTDELHAGRGGWSWYTGSAAWMLVLLAELLGYERRGNRVRVSALLGAWPEAGVIVRFGTSTYRLRSVQGAEGITLDGTAIEGEWIELKDDGAEHLAIFPPRRRNPKPENRPHIELIAQNPTPV